MAEDVAGAVKGPSVGGQVATALVLGAVLAGGFWFMAKSDMDGAAAREPAVCTASTGSLPSQYVSGTELCRALNRPDLPALLGTPEEKARNAWGSDGWLTVGSAKLPSPEGNVGLPTYSVKLSASYDGLPVARMGPLLGRTAEPTRVLGRTAVLYSDRTIALKIPLVGGSKAETGTGGIARHLLVAKDAKDGGGAYELVVWRQDEAVPDDTALLRVAERVLPTIPGWAAR
ncbi:DUF6215 domain-containing protein [Streptomyces showdoensis]|uniref:Uncharacterized protein n=1 Tax=Streptomyces showdoensis TaxID=68268 RepID=A0A2P2GEZ8_STREW|nr:DUF6215 domain-containing protein [Streptomyces showdoensis]KKZ70094.1 hypothetical protein VO63_30655 [Streptomyces showdoensis]